MAKAVLVTGGNAGIGFALCRQLAVEHGCRVFMGARSIERGESAAKSIRLPEGCDGSVELVHLDVSLDVSVTAAAGAVATRLLPGDQLYAIVNNAGVGFGSAATPEELLNINLYGPKRVCDAFVPLLNPTEGRIVNMGSDLGVTYVKECPPDAQAFLSSTPESWVHIESWARGEHGLGSPSDNMGGYGVSKALLACYTLLCAKEKPDITSSCVTPGLVDTKMTKGFGATRTPEEATVGVRHCLFAKLEGNGLFYGTSGERRTLS